MSPITGNDAQLFHAALARLEARVDDMEADLRAHEIVDQAQFSKVIDAIEKKKDADSSGRYIAVVTERDRAYALIEAQSTALEARQAQRRGLWAQLAISVVAVVIAALLGYFLAQ